MKIWCIIFLGICGCIICSGCDVSQQRLEENRAYNAWRLQQIQIYQPGVIVRVKSTNIIGVITNVWSNEVLITYEDKVGVIQHKTLEFYLIEPVAAQPEKAD